MFSEVFEQILRREGVYSDRPADRGGKTKYGVTEAVARAHGYTGEMKDLSLGWAHRIYHAAYWDPLSGDAIAAVYPHVAYELFDTGVNMGVGIAGQFLQRALNALNHRGADWGDLTVDGLVGPMTVHALQAYHDRRGGPGEDVLLAALNALQGARYIGIAEHDETQEDNVYGWLAQRVAQ